MLCDGDVTHDLAMVMLLMFVSQQCLHGIRVILVACLVHAV